jgi:PHP family Zn ribbon phosphoesterase
MTPKTQGKATNSMNSQVRNTQKLLRIKTGALSVLSFGRELLGLSLPAHIFPPMISPATIVAKVPILT